MRSCVIVISLLCMVFLSTAQEKWSDSEQYDAYVKGDWKKVVELGKMAKKSGADYYYIRARNGYANFMLGKYFKAEKEFEKALKFNSSDPFVKRYGYWSSVYAGQLSAALYKTTKMTEAEKDTFQVRQPKLFNRVSVLGGYRISTSQNLVGNMPYASLFFGHELGKRISLNHGLSYLSQQRASYTDVTQKNLVWQIGYLASLGIQVAAHTRIIPSFIVQYWESEARNGLDMGATLAAKQHFGNFDLTLLGAFMQDSDTNKFTVGTTLAWYPLGNPNLYSLTSFSYVFASKRGLRNPVFKQTIGGKLFKNFWLRSTGVWNNQLIYFEDEALDFSNTSEDRLRWQWMITPTYYPIDKLGVSLTYSLESRQFWRAGGIQFQSSNKYNFHSFYLGLNYNF